MALNYAGSMSVEPPTPDRLYLRLYVAGFSPRSQAAINSLRQILNERAPGKYDLEIVDIYQQPEMAREGQIVATPTLVKYLPAPRKILIGDFSRPARVIASLAL